MSAQGGGSYGRELYLAATTNIYTGQDDTTALEGYNLAADTHTSQVIVVPFPIKGAGLVFDTGAATAGTVQPKLQVTFNWDAQTAVWFDVPETAGTTTAVQLSTALGANSSGFEWYGCHIPGSWRVASHTTAATGPKRGNVAIRVSLVGSSANLDIDIARLFLIESISRGS
jgi:hypothetical protein